MSRPCYCGGCAECLRDQGYVEGCPDCGGFDCECSDCGSCDAMCDCAEVATLRTVNAECATTEAA